MVQLLLFLTFPLPARWLLVLTLVLHYTKRPADASHFHLITLRDRENKLFPCGMLGSSVS